MKKVLLSNMIYACVLCTTISFGSGWTVLAELPAGSEFGRIGKISEDLYTFDLIEEVGDTLYRIEFSVDIEGRQTEISNEVFVFPIPPVENTFILSAPQEYIQGGETFADISCISPWADTLWTVRFNGISPQAQTRQPIIPCRDGGCFAVFRPSSMNSLWRVYRLSNSGEMQMSGEFQMQGGPINSVSNVLETSDSNFLIAGTTDDLGMNLFMYLVGINNNGDLFIDIKEHFNFHAGANILEVDELGNIFITGYTGYERDDGIFMPPQDTDVFLLKLDPEGRELYRTIFQYPNENKPVKIKITDSGEVLMVIKSFSYESADVSFEYALLVYQQ